MLHRLTPLLGNVTRDEPEPAHIDPALVLVEGRVLPAGCQQPQALRFGESAPNAVRLAGRECMRRTLGANRTCSADGLGRRLAARSRCATLPVGVEELSAV